MRSLKNNNTTNHLKKQADFTPCVQNNQPAKPFNLPKRLNSLKRELSPSVKKWRDEQYKPYFQNPKNQPMQIESIFINIEFTALKHCYAENIKIKRKRYFIIAQWRARRAYFKWYSKYDFP